MLSDGTAISRLSGAELKPYRRRMQMVFEDPFSSLNPRMTVAQSLTMPLRLNAPDLDRAR